MKSLYIRIYIMFPFFSEFNMVSELLLRFFHGLSRRNKCFRSYTIFVFICEDVCTTNLFLQHLYEAWREELLPMVEGVLRGHKLHHFVVNPSIPLRYISESDRELGIVNLSYDEWEQHGSLLSTWLLWMISESFLPGVLSCRQSWHIGDTTRSRQLRSELLSISKGEKSVSELLIRYQAVAGILLPRLVIQFCFVILMRLFWNRFLQSSILLLLLWIMVRILLPCVSWRRNSSLMKLFWKNPKMIL